MIGVVSFHTKMDLAQNGGILLSFGALELPHPTCQPLSSKQFRPGSPVIGVTSRLTRVFAVQKSREMELPWHGFLLITS